MKRVDIKKRIQELLEISRKHGPWNDIPFFADGALELAS